MRIHHLNCATMCPACSWLFALRAPGVTPAAHRAHDHPMVAHCLLIEARHGLVLVDTGLGTGDIVEPARLGTFFRKAMRPALQVSETALAQVRALGFSEHDVRDIVLTHLDLDHAGGIGDFPQARIHVLAAEHRAALHPGLRERLRYVQGQWAHQPHWKTHEATGEKWFGFDRVRAIEGMDDDLLMIPLAGHTRGHSAIAVRQEGEGKLPWLMHCGDAYFSHTEMTNPEQCPTGLRIFQTLVEIDRGQRLANQHRLRELAAHERHQVDLICAHDPLDLARHCAA